MKIEHLGLNVPDPVAQAAWYVQNMGMRIVRSSNSGSKAQFLIDSAGANIIEIYYNPAAPVPDYRSMDPLVLHLAFASDDVGGTCKRLLAAGATTVSEPSVGPSGDELAMLRDPWGLAVQIARRSRPMA